MRTALGVASVLAALLLGSVPATADDAAEHDYLLHCAGCHRFDGSGSAAVPALDQVARYAASSGGREYLVRVPGIAQAPLSDERLAALLDYVVATFGDGRAVPSFRGQEVAAFRERPLRDPLGARARLVEPF